ncbi:MAG: acetyltransferase, partial [Bacteroidetes bacterium]
AGVVVNANARLGNHGILHAQCTIDYEVSIKDYVEVGAGSIVGSGVSIGTGVFIGAGATLVSGVTVGDHARIGAGSVVISDVAKNETVFGNPAQKIVDK